MNNLSNKLTNEYRELCTIVANPLDSPGKGGNASVKPNDKLLMIKSSGEDMKNPFHLYSQGIGNDYNIKPSMEYKMHQHINKRFVLHYHPVYVLPYLCSDYSFDFGTTLEYYSPGKELAKAVKEAAKDVDDVDGEHIFFLRNHGVIIAADTIDEIKVLYNKIKDTFFIEENTIFTPDDLIDNKSDELWLFRQYIKYVALVEGLNTKTLSNENINILNNDNNEKYRKEKM